MAVQPFPVRFDVGPSEYRETLDIRPNELLLAFTPGTTDGQIETVLGSFGVEEHTGPDQEVVRRVRSQWMRWVDVPASLDARDVARKLLDQVPDCWLASPVYVPGFNPHPANASAPMPGTLIVRPDDPADSATVTATVNVIRSLGFVVDDDWSATMKTLLRFHRVDGLTDDGFELRERVEQLGGVGAAEHDWLKLDPLEFSPTNQFYAKQWNLKAIGMPSAWNKTKGKATVTIAVIDSGFDLPHTALAASFTPPVLRVWVTSGPGGPGANPPPVFLPDPQVEPMSPTTGPTLPGTTCILTTSDMRWHGTAVAGIIAGSHAVAASRIAGIAPKCRLMPIRAWPMSVSNVAAGLVWAADHGADVVNFSITAPASDQSLYDAVTYAYSQKDVVICAASGNGVKGMALNAPVEYPARYGQVIAVGACVTSGLPKRLTSTGEQWFSEEGAEISVLAPGLTIPTTDARGAAGYNRGDPQRCLFWYEKRYAAAASGPAGGNYIFAFTGTSAAVAHVSSVAGLIRSVKPGLTNADVRDVLEKTCDKPGGVANFPVPTPNGNRSMTMGYGRINAAKAVS